MLSFLFNKSCMFCSEKAEYLCESCKAKVKKYEVSNYNDMIFGYKYKDEIRHAIIDLKFNNKRYVSKGLAKLFLDKIEDINFDEIDIITYVPISKKRMRERGYNQCELILKEICKQKKIKAPLEILKRTHTIAQSKLGQVERRTSVINAFEVIKNVENQTILLFDDIYTTGSTISEVVRVLKQANARRIYVCILAKT